MSKKHLENLHIKSKMEEEVQNSYQLYTLEDTLINILLNFGTKVLRKISDKEWSNMMI